MYNLARMTLGDMAHASAHLRKLGVGATCMEEASHRVARFLFEQFGEPEKLERGCVLVRVYKTHSFGQLPPDLEQYATAVAGPEVLTPEVRCLALLGTIGVEPAWTSRHTSVGHRAIPLPSVEAIARLPMVAQLLLQLGVDVGALVARPSTSDGTSPVRPDGDRALMVDDAERTYNVFHVAEARGSAFIPAQDFVERYGVRSVLGFGGQFPDGQLYAVIMFSRLHVTRDTAESFRPLTLATKLALLPFVAGNVFSEGTKRAQ